MPTKLLPAYQLDSEHVKEFLWEILPRLYKSSTLTAANREGDVAKLKGFLKSVDSSMSEFRVLLKDIVLEWLDPWKTPYPLLAFLSPIIGVDFNYDIPEEYARREVADAIYMWQHKGSLENIRVVTRIFTGVEEGDVFIKEYFRYVIRTNVYDQAYPENTLPGLSERHTTNNWDDTFFSIPSRYAIAYGTHGGTFLYRNHIGIYIEVPDSINLNLWYGHSYSEVLLEKLERTLEKVLLFGVVADIIWAVMYEEYLQLVYNTTETGESITATWDAGLVDKVLPFGYNTFFTNNTVNPFSLEVLPVYNFKTNNISYETADISIMHVKEFCTDVISP